MSFDYSTLITDRTAADVSRAKTLAAKTWSGMTAAEQAEWLRGLKGAYNAADINRVSGALNDLAGMLETMGYNVPVALSADWTAADALRPGNAVTLLATLASVRAALAVLPTTPDVPETMENLTWQTANDIEQILLDVLAQYRTMLTTRVPCGAATSGGDYL